MSEDTVVGTVSEEAPSEVKSSVVHYEVHSMVRSRFNRTARAAMPVHHRKKQYITNAQRLLKHGRPLRITEEVLRENLEELREKEKLHMLEVRTLDGKLVNLETLEVSPGRPPALAPHFRQDSVEYDKPIGQFIPPYVGDDATAMPDVLMHGELPSLLQELHAEKENAEAAAEDRRLAAEAETKAPPPLSVEESTEGAVDAAMEVASDEDETEAAVEEEVPPSDAETDSATPHAKKKHKRVR